MHIRQQQSFFFTNRTGEEKGMWLRHIMPEFSKSETYFSILAFWKNG